MKRKLLFAVVLFLVAFKLAPQLPVFEPASPKPRNAESFKTTTKRPAPKDLQGYARTLRGCVRPGARIRNFVASFPGTPLQKVAAIYRAVSKRWTYEPDPDTGEDWVEPADDLMKHGMRGNCKDIAIVLSSMMTALDVKNRIVTTVGSSLYPPHAYTEILVNNGDSGANRILDGLSAVWGSRKIVYHKDAEGIWIALDGGLPPDLYRGKLEYAFYPDGRIVDLRER